MQNVKVKMKDGALEITLYKRQVAELRKAKDIGLTLVALQASEGTALVEAVDAVLSEYSEAEESSEEENDAVEN